MNTQENNKLIADFMGVRNIDDTKYIETLKEMRADGLYFEQGYMTSELKYDTDWNWLMIVVDKIQLLDIVHDNTRSYDSVYKEWVCTFSPAYKTHDFGNIIGKSKNSEFEAVFNACMDFIKWYNLNNLKNS